MTEEVKIDRVRQSTLLPDLSRVTATVVGAGAIGSHFVEAVAKLGIGTVHLYDDDTVEAHNLANQGFYLTELGKNKAVALKERLEPGTGIVIHAHEARVTADTELVHTDLFVCAVDSMAARKTLWEKWKAAPTEVFLDHRMAAQAGSIFVVRKDDAGDIGHYEANLWTDEEVVQEKCTERSTIYCAYGIVAFSIGALTRLFLDKAVAREIVLDLTIPMVGGMESK